MLPTVDAASYGAGQLMTALDDASRTFRDFGHTQARTHTPIRWDPLNQLGRGIAPLATVGVVFHLDDAEHRDVCVGVSIWFRDDQFLIQADVTVDDPIPVRGGSGNQRFLLDLPDVHTVQLDECLATLRGYTARLCSYTSILDDLGIQRTA